jgi:hypothetical protein
VSKVIFSVTDVQEAALRAIAAAGPAGGNLGYGRVAELSRGVLVQRGWCAESPKRVRWNDLVLTSKGKAVLRLLDALAKPEGRS